MRWIIEWHETCTVLRFEGDLMVGATEFFETGIMPWLKKPFTPLVLDLSDMKIIVSAGLSTLIRVHRAAEQAEAHFVIVKPDREAWQALVLTRLDRLFPAFDTADEAISRLSEITS